MDRFTVKRQLCDAAEHLGCWSVRHVTNIAWAKETKPDNKVSFPLSNVIELNWWQLLNKTGWKKNKNGQENEQFKQVTCFLCEIKKHMNFLFEYF